MTIIFQYTIPNFFMIIQAILSILSYAFLFYGGRSLQSTRESYIRSDLFIKGGIISIILFIIRLCFPGWTAYNLTPEETQLIFILTILFSLPDYLIYIVVYGIFFMVIGFNNKSNYGYFLLSAGILFILRTIFGILSYFSINYADNRGMIVINHFWTYFSVSAMVIFLIYTLLINEKWLSVSGVSLIANHLISIFYIYLI
ncbi:MAG: hypothetical protein ACFE9Q_14475 [Candidatus Hodarchaeota archaeon]